MAKSKQSKAERDRRKAKKAARRKDRQARRPTANPGRPEWALTPWDPLRDGIHGWAARERTDFWRAALDLDGREDLPEGLWTPRRVAALSTEDLVGRLAALGVQTDPASFRALADTWHTATAMVVHGWRAPMPEGALDQDLVLLAARELYRRCVDRWLCLEDIDELWRVGLRTEAESTRGALTLARRVSDALEPHLADPHVNYRDLVGTSEALQGWFFTVNEEARAAAEEGDPQVAGLALPILERLAQAEGLHTFDRVDLLIALGRVWTATGQAERVRPELLAWSEAQASGAGVVALVEVLGAGDDDCAPALRREAAALLRGARGRGWEDWEELGGDELLSDIEALLEG
ncbi:hypothetical protein L6R53_27960 [Myxococcota bacterium]|nr:hypothetical protein [Myxococcota bacterium]